MTTSKLTFAGFIVASLFLGACSKDDSPGTRCGLDPSCGGTVTSTSTTSNTVSNVIATGLSCTAVLDSNVTLPGKNRALTVTASGGTPPYTMPDFGTFTSSLVANGSFNNGGTSNLILNRTANIYDSQYQTAACSFSVTVLPADSSSLGCQVTVSNANPSKNENVTFTFQALGGTGSYHWAQFYDGISALKDVSGANSPQASIVVSYATSGNYFTHLGLWNDGSNSKVDCTQTISVK